MIQRTDEPYFVIVLRQKMLSESAAARSGKQGKGDEE